jgi:hypothetical protein
LKNELRKTCPEFRAWKKGDKGPSSQVPLPDFLLEDGEPLAFSETHTVIYLEDVIDKRIR